MLCLRQKLSTSRKVCCFEVKILMLANANNITNNCKISLIIAALLLVSSFSLYAQQIEGGFSESYLQRNVGVRPIAMAGTYTAISNESMGIFYNPAGLSSYTEQAEFSTMFSALQFGRTHSALSWGQSFFENVGFGAAINSFTTGSFMSRDVKGNPLGNMTSWQYSAIAGASYTIDYASFGVAGKYISHTVSNSDIKANGYGLDLGAIFNVMDLFSFGLSVQNVSGMVFWNGEEDKTAYLPYLVRSGIAMEIGLNDEEYQSRSTVTGELESYYIPPTRYLLLGFDAVLNQYDNNPTFTVGAELVAHEAIAFRGGIAIAGDNLGKFSFFPMTYWGFGVSLRPEIEYLEFLRSIDYSLANDKLSRTGISHHISINIDFKY